VFLFLCRNAASKQAAAASNDRDRMSTKALLHPLPASGASQENEGAIASNRILDIASPLIYGSSVAPNPQALVPARKYGALLCEAGARTRALSAQDSGTPLDC